MYRVSFVLWCMQAIVSPHVKNIPNNKFTLYSILTIMGISSVISPIALWALSKVMLVEPDLTTISSIGMFVYLAIGMLMYFIFPKQLRGKCRLTK